MATGRTIAQLKTMLAQFPDNARVEFWLIRKQRSLGEALVELEIGPSFVNDPARQPNEELVEIVMGEIGV